MPRKLAKNSLELKNFLAWIEVDGEKLNCHATDIPNKRAREASCWIASEENKTFSVRLDKTHFTNCHFRVSLSLDGTKTDDQLFEKREDCKAIFDGLHTDDGFRHFKFAPLNITDEAEYRDVIALRPEARQIGEITLRVHRVTHLKTTAHREGETPHCGGDELGEDDSDEESVLKPQKVHESSLKATLVPHQISLGDLIPNTKQVLPSAGVDKGTPKTSTTRTKYYYLTWYTQKECMATFTFRYRPLDVLVDGGIVSRRALNPEAESSEDQNEDDDDKDEDMNADDRQIPGSPLSTENEGDESDIYVRTDGEQPTREAQAQDHLLVPIQPEGHASTVALSVPAGKSPVSASGIGLNSSTTVTPALTSGQWNVKTIPTEIVAPTQALQEVATKEPSAVNNQWQTLPVVRQESEGPTLNLGGAAVGERRQTKDLKPSGPIAKKEARDIKLEEIERKVLPSSEDEEEEEEERELRLKLEAIKERKRKNKELQRAEAVKRVKVEPENRFYFKPGEVVDLVSS